MRTALQPSLAPATPSVVDDVTVRLIAGFILAAGILAAATQQWWVHALLAVDFALRAFVGPHVSPLARFVRRFVRPRVALPPRPTAGTPKRFAAGIGAVMTTGLVAAWLIHLATDAGAPLAVVWVIAAIMAVFPALEAVAGVCVGCILYGFLARRGVLRDDLCIDCVQPGVRAVA